MRNVDKSDALSNNTSRISSPELIIRIKNNRDSKRKSINTNNNIGS